MFSPADAKTEVNSEDEEDELEKSVRRKQREFQEKEGDIINDCETKERRYLERETVWKAGGDPSLVPNRVSVPKSPRTPSPPGGGGPEKGPVRVRRSGSPEDTSNSKSKGRSRSRERKDKSKERRRSRSKSKGDDQEEDKRSRFGSPSTLLQCFLHYNYVFAEACKSSSHKYSKVHLVVD